MGCQTCPVQNVCPVGKKVKQAEAVTQAQYNSDNKHTWCPGCGNYSIWGSVKNALVVEQIASHDVLFVHDIGCNGNGADKIGGYGFKGIHGRALPLAAGAQIANSNQTVIASSGDGAILAEGIGHLIHAIRSNYNITFIIHNNANFALTTGQASPATPLGAKMNATPSGVIIPPINIAQLVLSLNPSFYARAYSGKQKQLTELISAGIHHKGFSIIEVMQACPTYNHEMTNEWYREHVYEISEKDSHDVSSLEQAVTISKDTEKKIALGIIYQDYKRPSFMESNIERKGIKTELIDEVKSFNIKGLIKEFK